MGEHKNEMSENERNLLSRQLLLEAEKYSQGSSSWLNNLDEAIRLNPNNSSAYRVKSIWFTKTGDYEQAYLLLNKAVDLSPIENLGYRGWLKLFKIHDFEGCIEDLETLVRISSTGIKFKFIEDTDYLIGIAKMQLGNFSDAIARFDVCLGKTDVSVRTSKYLHFIIIDKGICLTNLGKLDYAVSLFESALDVDPECPEAHYRKGIAFELLNKKLEAHACFETCLLLAKKGKIRSDPYKDYFNQLYVEDIEEKLVSFF